MMLQVLSKKFFKSDNYHRTIEKYIIYSNVNIFGKVETQVATLENIETFNGITTYVLTFENVLEYQKDPRFQLVSVGQKQIVEDLLACFSFYFDGIFSIDRNYIENLLRDCQQNICDTNFPHKLLPNIFKRNINVDINKAELLDKFLKNLIALPNKKYMKVITSIKQLYNAVLIISSNINLAYTMIVASIESLATNFDDYQTVWEDCLIQNKRRQELDKLLTKVDNSIAEEIKKVIIEDTHAKLGTRYANFILKYIDDSYYEERIGDGIARCRESQLKTAIKNSYQIRSSYIHALEDMPPFMTLSDNVEVFNEENKNFFSFFGLIRISKFVINKYIKTEEKLEKEDLNYFEYIPGTIKVQLASEYWIGNADNYCSNNVQNYYQGLLEFISKGEYKTKGFIDLRKVCYKIEKLIDGENNKNKKIYMLCFYLLYNYMVSEKFRCINFDKVEEKYESLLEEPIMAIVMLYTILGVTFPWDLQMLEDIYSKYDSNRNNKNTLKIPCKFEICLIFDIINSAYSEDKKEVLEKYITKVFRESPDDKFIKDIYSKFKNTKEFQIVSWYEHYIYTDK